MAQRSVERFVAETELVQALPNFVVSLNLAELPRKYRELLEEKNSPLLELPEELVFRPGVNLIVGANGAGKSTVLHALSEAYFPDQVAAHADTSRIARSLATAVSGLMASPQMTENSVAIDIEAGKFLQRTSTAHLSQRQGLDLLLGRMLKQYDEQLEITIGEEPSLENLIICIDEPELGMDPQRQKKIVDEVLRLLQYAHYVFVATNSPYLFESDLPRLDLSQPEKGVIVPSEELAKSLSGGFNESSFEFGDEDTDSS